MFQSLQLTHMQLFPGIPRFLSILVSIANILEGEDQSCYVDTVAMGQR